MDAWTVLGVSGKTADGLMVLRWGKCIGSVGKDFFDLILINVQLLPMDGLKTIGAIRGRIEAGRR
jgi:hypothetical protein